MAARLRDRYQAEVLPALTEEFKYPNPMAVPRLRKIVVNIGLGEARQNVKLLDAAVRELGQVAGQKPVVTRARKSIANFKLRKNMPIGTMVTLRGDRMYEFFDRLVNVALPRVRDFRGLSTKSFDGRGSYTLGLRDQLGFSGSGVREGRKGQGDEYFNCDAMRVRTPRRWRCSGIWGCHSALKLRGGGRQGDSREQAGG